MTHIEKTVFISYRRKDISWALAVYQYLTIQKYDVFFDFSSLSSGDFGQVIISNIKARAHFVLILTPTALDRCSEPGDWLRREIETAIDEERNIIPLFFDGFSFGSPSVAEKLTGKLGAINRYNGLDIPSGYFMEAMERLRGRYLNVPLDAVIHPVSTEVRKVVKDEQVAANNALIQRWEDIKELVKPAKEKMVTESISPIGKEVSGTGKIPGLRPYGIGMGILLVVTLGILGVNALNQNIPTKNTPTSSHRPPARTSTSSPTHIVPTNIITQDPPVAVPTIDVGRPMTSPKDGMILLYVPAGEFIMGSDSGEVDEKPVGNIALDAFWIDQTEITNAMYAKCVEASICKQPTNTSSTTRLSYYRNSEFDNYPVIYVDWNMANAYCSWAERRLPTEAEWEKAARGENANIYPWGNESPNKNLLNYNSNVGDTTAVGKYPNGKSIYGALDMAGNVWEWVSSLYQSYPYSAGDGRENLSSSGARVLRGGSLGYDDYAVRSAFRHEIDSSYSDLSLGFRCARSQ